MVKVKALDTYQVIGVKDNELKRIPTAGEVFEVSEDRLKVLLGANEYNKAFVEVVQFNNDKKNK